MSEQIDWVDEITLKHLETFKEEIFVNMMETFNLLDDTGKLEAFLALLPEEKRDALYSHPILKEYDLLP